MTIVEAEDRALLLRFLTAVERQVDLPALRRDRAPRGPDVWPMLVSQVCVMGSARGMERLHQTGQIAAFRRATSLSACKAHTRASELARVFAELGATRFPNVAAKKVRKLMALPSVVSTRRCVLLAGLRGVEGADAIRDTLMARCPIFGPKSASDFMIEAGLSHDVIALDVRVVGALAKYLGYNLPASRVQGRRAIYLSVESALGEACAAAGKPLALLDRALFQLGGISALELAMRQARQG